MTWGRCQGQVTCSRLKLMKRNSSTPTSSKDNDARLGEVIKLGVDVHLESYVVAMKIDGSAPARPRRMTPDQFLSWILELRQRCDQIFTCYEAGCFGYCLHRSLEKLGVTNYVIRPICWDQYGKKVKTDGLDATEMVLALDGYLRGNERSFSTVRVPTEQEERLRSLTRQRQSFVKERQRMAAKARSHALYYGRRIAGEWWKPRRWKALEQELEGHLLELIAPLRELLLAIEQQIKACDKRLADMSAQALPSGMGTTLFQQIEREVGDWTRFENRRQVAGYTGLCPSEDSSAQRCFKGSISKHGNPRLRAMLVEQAWLLMRWNPGYLGVEKWRGQLEAATLAKSAKKKIVVAIARQFAVDWWRLRTGRATAKELNLEMKQA